MYARQDDATQGFLPSGQAVQAPHRSAVAVDTAVALRLSIFLFIGHALSHQLDVCSLHHAAYARLQSYSRLDCGVSCYLLPKDLDETLAHRLEDLNVSGVVNGRAELVLEILILQRVQSEDERSRPRSPIVDLDPEKLRSANMSLSGEMMLVAVHHGQGDVRLVCQLKLIWPLAEQDQPVVSDHHLGQGSDLYGELVNPVQHNNFVLGR